MKPLRADPKDTDVIVRSEVVPAARRTDPARLPAEQAGRGWKIYDVNVLGVWLIETYRNQFGQEVSDGGIDGLIRTLTDKNRAFAAGAQVLNRAARTRPTVPIGHAKRPRDASPSTPRRTCSRSSRVRSPATVGRSTCPGAPSSTRR